MCKLEVLAEATLLLLLLLALRLGSSSVQLAAATPLASSVTHIGDTQIHTTDILPLSSASEQSTVPPASLHEHERDASQPRSSYSQPPESLVLNEIRSPIDGSVNTLPVQFACRFKTTNYDDFARAHGHQLLCIEVAQRWRRCEPTLQTPPVFTALPAGNHSAVAFLVDSIESNERTHESAPIHFTVLLESDYRVYVEQQTRRMREQFGVEDDPDLLAWAATQQQHADHDDSEHSQSLPLLARVTERYVQADGGSVTTSMSSESARNATSPHSDSSSSIGNASSTTNSGKESDGTTRQSPPLTLLIGVKTSVLHGFAARQAIRSTWGTKSHLNALGVTLVFIGCVPSLADAPAHQRAALAHAVEIERRTFGDLLTHELDCHDGYALLPAKVTAFLQLAATAFAHVPYVMIADDDIYLRVDEVVRALQQHGPRSRFYAGQVWAKQFLSPVAPVRNPRHKNFLSVEQYPLAALPPFAFGPHVLLSMDCAAFVGENRHDLGALAALDDVSLALWLLALQVHPEHLSGFHNLRDSSCSDSFVSLADLMPAAIRIVHANVQVRAPFCRGFDVAVWVKPSHGPDTSQLLHVTLNVEAQILADELHVVTHVFDNDNGGNDSAGAAQFVFVPARESLAAHAAAVMTFVNSRSEWHQFVPSEITTTIERLMNDTIAQLVETQAISSARLALWRHSLQLIGEHSQREAASSLLPRTFTIVYSQNGAYGKAILECVFTEIYRHHSVRVVDEATHLREKQAAADAGEAPPSIDVFAFHILDGACSSNWGEPCQRATQTFIDRYSDTAALIMISGEHWDVDTLDERVLLLSTVSDVARHKHVYVPMASMVFSSLRISPMVLLENSAERVQRQHLPSPSERKFCAYMYARCDRPQREYMFDLLNAMERVDALGVCQGSSQPERPERWLARVDSDAFSAAIEMYTQYKFVIAFENAQLRPGYVTEKLVTAFLAGSIPVYLGHSHSLAHVFNPASFIDCGTFATLRACALRVLQVHRSPELYAHMLREPVVANATLFLELFSWHPDVPSSHISDEVERLLQR